MVKFIFWDATFLIDGTNLRKRSNTNYNYAKRSKPDSLTENAQGIEKKIFSSK